MKTITRMLLACSLVAVALTLGGCVSRLGAFTVLSTKNIDWSRTQEYVRYSDKTKGKDINHIIIFIPTKANVNIEDAVDDAIEKIPGGIALVDAVVRYRSFSIPFIYAQAGYIVEGSVLIDPKLIDPKLAEIAEGDVENTTYYISYIEDNETKLLPVSEEEYMKYSIM